MSDVRIGADGKLWKLNDDRAIYGWWPATPLEVLESVRRRLDKGGLTREELEVIQRELDGIDMLQRRAFADLASANAPAFAERERFEERERALKADQDALEELRLEFAERARALEAEKYAAARAKVLLNDSNPVKAANEIARRAAEFQEAERKAGRHVSIDVAVQRVTKAD